MTPRSRTMHSRHAVHAHEIAFCRSRQGDRRTSLREQLAPAEIDIATDTRTLAPDKRSWRCTASTSTATRHTREAVDRGAKLLIVDNADAIVPGTAALLVRDTLKAYLSLASAARAKFRGPRDRDHRQLGQDHDQAFWRSCSRCAMARACSPHRQTKTTRSA